MVDTGGHSSVCARVSFGHTTTAIHDNEYTPTIRWRWTTHLVCRPTPNATHHTAETKTRKRFMRGLRRLRLSKRKKNDTRGHDRIVDMRRGQSLWSLSGETTPFSPTNYCFLVPIVGDKKKGCVHITLFNTA